jgi:phosphoserine aminotransferase
MNDVTRAAEAATLPAKPATKPARPFFSSGPCAKPPGWSAEKLAAESLGRSHRSKIGKNRLQYCIDLMRELLNLPETHRIGIVPGSDTGAFEMAMWTMLGARPVTTLAWESFGEGWVTDAAKQLKIDPTIIRADYGQLPGGQGSPNMKIDGQCLRTAVFKRVAEATASATHHFCASGYDEKRRLRRHCGAKQ